MTTAAGAGSRTPSAPVAALLVLRCPQVLRSGQGSARGLAPALKACLEFVAASLRCVALGPEGALVAVELRVAGPPMGAARVLRRAADDLAAQSSGASVAGRAASAALLAEAASLGSRADAVAPAAVEAAVEAVVGCMAAVTTADGVRRRVSLVSSSAVLAAASRVRAVASPFGRGAIIRESPASAVSVSGLNAAKAAGPFCVLCTESPAPGVAGDQSVLFWARVL